MGFGLGRSASAHTNNIASHGPPPVTPRLHYIPAKLIRPYARDDFMMSDAIVQDAPPIELIGHRGRFSFISSFIELLLSLADVDAAADYRAAHFRQVTRA